MDALTFIQDQKSPALQPFYVLAGDERFLKRLASARIQVLAIGEGSSDLARSVYEGESAKWAEIIDDLETLPFLAPRRLVIVDDADTFVTRYRETLEEYLASPRRTGVLVLDVKSWKSNTRLAKALPDAATITCKAPDVSRLPAWCSQWARAQYGKQISSSAASLLVELVGGDMGVLDQELAKLATYVGAAPQIEATDVDTLVSHSRVESAWKMLDAIAEGDKANAFTTLYYLLDQGEDPFAIFGAVSWQLKRLAQVARLTRLGQSVGSAMSRASVPPFAQKRLEQQLRQLGPRALQIYGWLLEADSTMKSSGGLTPSMVLERLLVKLAAN